MSALLPSAAIVSAARQIDISLWSDPSKTYQGKLREVSPSADPVTRTYAAKITEMLGAKSSDQ